MRKPFLLLFALLICLGTISDAVNQTSSYQENGIDSLKLETESISYCLWGRFEEGNCSKKPTIQVLASSEIAEREGLSYYYKVDGGKIVGNGSYVIWDLSDTKMGQYTITAGVGKDSKIKGKTITKKIQLRDCEVCHSPCYCATISVSGPYVLPKSRGEMIFTANVLGGSQDSVTYNWTVSNGKIAEGQGTSRIIVKTTKEMKGQTITATVDVGGLCDSNCPRTASASAEIKNK